ncbi:MAG: hypothetical protein EXS12_01200 [Phycisphaerales bacterium]|nr:hypothetical protein [Phycisphaerales bacterium]
MTQRQFVILSRTNNKDGTLGAIGSRADVVKSLSLRNTCADIEGGQVLYGPGVNIELTPDQDPVLQMLLTITDDDIAWTVIMKLAKDLQWKVLDPTSGREFSPS